MRDRRRSLSQYSTAFEDAGLFKKPVVNIRVEMLPQMQRNLRQDLLVQGIVGHQGKSGQTQNITVVFAGRRMKQAEPIRLHLERLQSQARRSALGQSNFLADPPVVPRLATIIEGAWRVNFERDPTGWETRSYSLMAARWTFRGFDGITNYCGIPPQQSQKKKP